MLGDTVDIPVTITMHCVEQWRTKRGGGFRAATRPDPQTRNSKNTDFVDIMISKVLRDFPFSRNQPLKSADDQYIRILKNKLVKLKKTRRQDTVI
jgi:hypothetical protein